MNIAKPEPKNVFKRWNDKIREENVIKNDNCWYKLLASMASYM
jgi:hypothetical protein